MSENKCKQVLTTIKTLTSYWYLSAKIFAHVYQLAFDSKYTQQKLLFETEINFWVITWKIKSNGQKSAKRKCCLKTVA